MHVCGRVHTIRFHNLAKLMPATSALDVHLLYFPSRLESR